MNVKWVDLPSLKAPQTRVNLNVRYWTTPEGERRREAEVGFFHFRGTLLCQVGFRPQLVARLAEVQAG